MTSKPLVTSAPALGDIMATIEHYKSEVGPWIADRFAGDLQSILVRIGQFPAAGSPRYAHEVNFPGLRSMRLRRFPFLLLYVERADRVEILRVLHARRDIPVSLGGDEPSDDT
jgi:toxin ParE1/3/4